MSVDIELEFDGEALTGDVVLAGALLAEERGLKTAIVVSLFSDARAGADDALPAGAGADDRRGWWGDLAPPAPSTLQGGDRIGSKLWLLSREKQLPETVRRARDYASEALQWLVDDGVAAAVTVEAEIPRTGILALGITVTRPDGAREEHRFSTLWEAL